MADSSYRPIDCNFYDLLEISAMRGKKALVCYRDEQGAEVEVTAVISNLEAVNGEEFMTLDNGLRIRLDRLVALNGQVVPGVKRH